MAEIDIDIAYGYDGSSIYTLPHDSIAYKCACGIKFYNPAEGTRSYLWSPKRRPVTALTFSSKRDKFAFAERGKNPIVYIYSYPEKRKLAELKDASVVELGDLAFDRAGNQLATLGTLPKFELQIWSLSGYPQVICESDCAQSHAKFVSFSPWSPTDLCTSGSGHVTFWKIEKSQNKQSLTSVDGKVPGTVSRFHTHTWSIGNEVYVGCKEGEIYGFDPTTGMGMILPETHGAEAITCISVSKHHLIAASEDGFLRFYYHQSKTLAKAIQLNTDRLSDFRFMQDWMSLVVGCEDGVLFNISLPGYDKPNIEDEYFEELQPKTTVVADFHSGPVTCCSHLVLEKCLATAGVDGTLRIWDYTYNTLKSKTPIGERPTIIRCGQGARTHTTLAIGYATGCVRLVDVEDVNLPKVVFREKLDESEVVALEFDPESTVVAVLLRNNKLFWIDVPEGQILGWIKVADECQATDCCWVDETPEERMVLVSMDNSHVLAFRPPVEGVVHSENPSYQLDRDALYANLWRLEYAAVKMCYAAAYLDRHQIFALGEDKCLAVIFLSKEMQPKPEDGKEEMIPLSPAALRYADFAKLGSTIALSPDKSMLMCCGQDGRCTVREAEKLLVEDPHSSLANLSARWVQRHSPFKTGINAAAWSMDGKSIFTVGEDGFVFGMKLKAARKDVPPYTLDAQREVEDEPEEEDVFNVKQQKAEEQFMVLANQAYRDQVKEKVAEMAVRLQTLKVQNANAEELEKLEAHEFMVDSVKDEARLEGDQMVEEVRESIRWQNVQREYYFDKIKKECYDTMEEKLVVIKGMLAETEVSNYNVRYKNKVDAKLLKKVKFLRGVQDEEFRRRQKPYFLDDLYADEEEEEEEEAAPPLTGGQSSMMSPTTGGGGGDFEDKEAEEKAKKDEAQKKANDEEGKPVAKVTDEMLADEPTLELQYSPFEEYTRHRAVTQMWLLNGQIHAFKKAFNQQHKAMLARKKADISKIQEKNIRVQQILAELELQEAIFKPSFVASEQPEKILQVLDSEIKIEKYYSPEELKRMEEAKIADAKRRAEQEDESVERGLKIMMDNRLDRDENATQVLKKPAFADEKPESEWTDEEQKEMRMYEKALEKQAEEDEKKRRALEQELKQVKKENQEIAQGFDAAVLGLLKDKLECDQQIFELDLRIIKLAQYVMQREEMEVKVTKLAGVLEEIKSKTAKSTQHVMDWKRELDNKTDLYQQYLMEERNIEKKFRMHFADSEEFIEVLLKLLRKKPKAKGKRGEQQDNADQGGSVDPFAAAETKTKVAAEPDVKLDKPDGLAEHVWQEFLHFRQQRNEQEREMKEISQELADMQKYHQTIKTANEELHAKLELNLRKMNEFQEQMVRDSYNLDYLSRYKQGQIEVEQAAVVTDYADAILIHKSKIMELNTDIRASGGEKVKILKEIKEFKKGIRAVEWETEMLDYSCGTLEVEYRHLHTLRVTKSMQEFIKGGGEGHNAMEQAKLLKKIEHTKKTFENKVEDKKHAILKIKKLVKEKAHENISLDEATAEATGIVRDRNEIVSLQNTGLDQARALKIMKDLRVTRKLEDVAKAQQDELVELKQRIDKLRERTFPSFAVVSKRVVGNPDEKDGPETF
mmetsp:Transcript_148955/g.260283  ORF Transcript_148955/g.260283 Transcript_148955/m.260283 type:complete len:1612 (-) Transcript_148955:446-5281(-)